MSLPAARDPLAEARELQEQAAQLGFDWDERSQLWAKLAEELEELRQAQVEGPKRIQEELGDVLFMIVNLARHLGCDPTQALASANTKFRGRFAHVVADLDALPERGDPERLAAMERRWQEAKQRERQAAKPTESGHAAPRATHPSRGSQ